MAKRNKCTLELSGFEELMKKLNDIEGSTKEITTLALETVGKKIGTDTLEALSDQYLPAGGKFHHKSRPTEASVVREPKVEWHGNIAEIGVGFDKTKPGSGGLLISGTPKMKPDMKLNAMYRGTAYMKKIDEEAQRIVAQYIEERMGKDGG